MMPAKRKLVFGRRKRGRTRKRIKTEAGVTMMRRRRRTIKKNDPKRYRAPTDLTVPCDTIWSNNAMAVNTLFSYDIIANTVAGFDRTKVAARQANYVDIVGISLTSQVFCDTTQNRPVMFHWVLASPTDDGFSTATSGFFTSRSSGTDGRTTVPFGAAEMTVYNGTPRNFYSVSKEQFKIFFHAKQMVYPDVSWAANAVISKRWTAGKLKKYVKIKERITFDNNTVGSASDPKIYLFTWVSPTTTGGTYPALTVAEHRAKVYMINQ